MWRLAFWRGLTLTLMVRSMQPRGGTVNTGAAPSRHELFDDCIFVGNP